MIKIDEQSQVIPDSVENIKNNADLYNEHLGGRNEHSALNFFINETILDLDDILEQIHPSYSGQLVKAFEQIIKYTITRGDK